jgi:hypothetical protein
MAGTKDGKDGFSPPSPVLHNQHIPVEIRSMKCPPLYSISTSPSLRQSPPYLLPVVCICHHPTALSAARISRHIRSIGLEIVSDKGIDCVCFVSRRVVGE